MLADADFDGAYILHVGMNIPDKQILRGAAHAGTGGLFGLHDTLLESDAPSPSRDRSACR
jgi:hypothetical protein